MKITFIPQDKIILKNDIPEIINDVAFLNNYSNIRCYQINTEGKSWIETKDRQTLPVSEQDINLISNKFDTEKQNRIQLQQEQLIAYKNTWERVRAERDELLEKTDLYMISDYPINEDKRNEFKNYRSNLRDITDTYSSNEPSTITFNEGSVLINSAIIMEYPQLD